MGEVLDEGEKTLLGAAKAGTTLGRCVWIDLPARADAKPRIREALLNAGCLRGKPGMWAEGRRFRGVPWVLPETAKCDLLLQTAVCVPEIGDALRAAGEDIEDILPRSPAAGQVWKPAGDIGSSRLITAFQMYWSDGGCESDIRFLCEIEGLFVGCSGDRAEVWAVQGMSSSVLRTAVSEAEASAGTRPFTDRVARLLGFGRQRGMLTKTGMASLAEGLKRLGAKKEGTASSPATLTSLSALHSALESGVPNPAETAWALNCDVEIKLIVVFPAADTEQAKAEAKDATKGRKRDFQQLGGKWSGKIGDPTGFWYIPAHTHLQPFRDLGGVRFRRGIGPDGSRHELTSEHVVTEEMSAQAARAGAAEFADSGASFTVLDPVRIVRLGPDDRDCSAEQVARRISGPLALAGDIDEEAVSEAVRTLAAEFPWMPGLVNAVSRSLTFGVLAGRRHLLLSPTLVWGPPGTGKTRFAKRLSRIFGVPGRVMSCEGKTGTVDLLGSERTYHGSQPSFMVRTIAAVRVANPILILDEVEKVGTSTYHGSLHAALLGLLERETAIACRDIHLDAELDLSRLNWIMTANGIDGLPEALLSRVECVRIGAPEPEHLDAILPGIVSDLEDFHNMPRGTLPELSAAFVATLRDRFARDRSIRVLRRTVERHYGDGRAPKVAVKVAETRTAEQDRKVAWHEAGHAVCMLSQGFPVAVATIDPDHDEAPGANGFVRQGHDLDRVADRGHWKARIAVLLAGRAAEAALLGADGVSSGAASDIAKATSIARQAVLEWGLSPLGVVPLDREGSPLSPESARRAEEEVAKLLSEAEAEAARILAERCGTLAALAEALLDRRTLTGPEIEEVALSVQVKGRPAIAAVSRSVARMAKNSAVAHMPEKPCNM